MTIMSDVLGRPILAAEPDFHDWAASAKLPYNDAQKQVLRQVHAHYAAHGSPGNSLTLRAILRRAPRSLREFIEELAAVQGSGAPASTSARKTANRKSL